MHLLAPRGNGPLNLLRHDVLAQPDATTLSAPGACFELLLGAGHRALHRGHALVLRSDAFGVFIQSLTSQPGAALRGDSPERPHHRTDCNGASG